MQSLKTAEALAPTGMVPAIPDGVRKVLRFWEIPFLGALAWLMLTVRMIPYDKLVRDGRAYYIGTDPFYHFREVLGGVRAWPRIPRYDPFTHYPYGTGTGQFGSLFDWLASTYIVMTRGRDASEQYVHEVVAAYPAVLGALLIIPFYFLAKRLLGTPGAVVASLTLAVLPGEFLIRSIAGYSDHHIAEAMFAVVALLGFAAAVDKTRGLVVSSQWNARDNLRIAGWGALAGAALWLDYLMWPPALLFAAIITLWLVIVILLENGRGGDARAMTVAASVGFVVSAILILPFVESTALGEFNNYGILHIVTGIAAAAVLLATDYASRRGDDRPRAAWTTFGGLAGLAVAGMLFLSMFMPGTWASIRWGLSWITGLGVPRTTLTISEARPADFFCAQDTGEASCLGNDFGIIAPVAFLVMLALIVFAVWKRRPSDILLAIWSIIIFRATDTQIRFSYYLAINMALLIGWLGARLVESIGGGAGTATPEEPDAAAPARPTKGRRVKSTARSAAPRDRWPWRGASAAVVLLLVLPGNVFATDRTIPGWEIAERGFSGPDSDVLMWTEALEWMRANTPDAGVDLGLVVPPPARGTLYEQAPESYGVLSWWDYGHWMEVIARRAPVANPFQQAAPFASCYLMERDPARAEAMLRMWSTDAWRRDGNVPCDDVPVPSLDDTPLPDENRIRYVMIDDEMAGGKFGAITVWAQCTECLHVNRSLPDRQFTSRDQYYHALFQYWKEFRQTDGTVRVAPWSGEAYHDTMLSRLYFEDANTLHNYRLVYETPYGVQMGWVAGFDEEGLFSHNQNDFLSGRTTWSPAEWSFRSGDVMYPTGDGRVIYDAARVASVKTYERVKGADLVGTGAAPGAEVSVVVPLRSDTTQREFSWRATVTAAEDGSFRVQVPYATGSYLSPDAGGTNLAVRATGDAMVTSGGATTVVAIPDAAVLEGQQVTIALG